MTEAQLRAIIAKYGGARHKAHLTGDFTYLWPRFERAAMAQMYDDNDGVAVSRYALWAETVRDAIIKGQSLLLEGDNAGGEKLLAHAANSLSAFYEVQCYFDPEKVLTPNTE